MLLGGSSSKRSACTGSAFILSLIIIAIAAVVLYRKLHNINVSKVLTAMATVEYRDVAISALFVAAGLFHA